MKTNSLWTVIILFFSAVTSGQVFIRLTAPVMSPDFVNASQWGRKIKKTSESQPSSGMSLQLWADRSSTRVQPDGDSSHIPEMQDTLPPFACFHHSCITSVWSNIPAEEHNVGSGRMLLPGPELGWAAHLGPIQHLRNKLDQPGRSHHSLEPTGSVADVRYQPGPGLQALVARLPHHELCQNLPTLCQTHLFQPAFPYTDISALSQDQPTDYWMKTDSHFLDKSGTGWICALSSRSWWGKCVRCFPINGFKKFLRKQDPHSSEWFEHLSKWQ